MSVLWCFRRLLVLLLLEKGCTLLTVRQLSAHVRRDFLRAALAYDPDDALVPGLDDACLSAAGNPPVHVLLLGDSVSRFQVWDSCARWKGILNKSCLAGLHYMHESKQGMDDYGAGCCRFPSRGSLSYVHLFGSSYEGLTACQKTSTAQAEDQLCPTSARVSHAIAEATAWIGSPPTAVVFRTDLWDIAALPADIHFNSTALKRELLERTVRSYVSNVGAIRNALPPGTLLATSTSPRPLPGWALPQRKLDEVFDSFEHAIRLVAVEQKMLIFDWNLLLQGTSPKSYLRDDHHPNAAFTVAFMAGFLRALNIWSVCGSNVSSTKLSPPTLQSCCSRFG